MGLLKVALLTSLSLRHKYIAHKLAEAFDLCLVVAEEKSSKITDTSHFPASDAHVLNQHFHEREISELKYFSNYSDFPSKDRLRLIAHGKINDAEVFELLKENNPDYILLFGTSIIKDPVLSYFEKRIINFHLGLSPYYKGSGTNFWPLYYSQPECVGGTIHLAIDKVDAGELLYQFRPSLSMADGLHDIGNKVILEGGQLIANVMQHYHIGRLTTATLPNISGRLFRIKDFNASAVLTVKSNFDSGMMDEYLSSKDSRDNLMPIYNPFWV